MIFVEPKFGLITAIIVIPPEVIRLETLINPVLKPLSVFAAPKLKLSTPFIDPIVIFPVPILTPSMLLEP